MMIVCMDNKILSANHLIGNEPRLRTRRSNDESSGCYETVAQPNLPENARDKRWKL